MISWETAQHSTASFAQIADVQRVDLPKIVRLYVKRAAPSSRHFVAFVDGYHVPGRTKSMAEAKTKAITYAKQQGIISQTQE